MPLPEDKSTVTCIAFGFQGLFLWSEIALLERSSCKTPAEKFLDSYNRFKQSRILGSQCFVAEHSVQPKNVFILYISTRITHRNTLLNDSDDWHFVSQTCLHCQSYCFSLCVQLVTYNAKWKKPLECEFWHILPAYFTTLMNFKNFKNDIFGCHTKYLSKKSAVIFPCPPTFNDSLC